MSSWTSLFWPSTTWWVLENFLNFILFCKKKYVPCYKDISLAIFAVFTRNPSKNTLLSNFISIRFIYSDQYMYVYASRTFIIFYDQKAYSWIGYDFTLDRTSRIRLSRYRRCCLWYGLKFIIHCIFFSKYSNISILNSSFS